MEPQFHLPIGFGTLTEPSIQACEVALDYCLDYETTFPHTDRRVFTALDGKVVDILTIWDCHSDDNLGYLDLLGCLGDLHGVGIMTIQRYLREDTCQNTLRHVFFDRVNVDLSVTF